MGQFIQKYLKGSLKRLTGEQSEILVAIYDPTSGNEALCGKIFSYEQKMLSKVKISQKLKYAWIKIWYGNHFGVKMFLRYWTICWIKNVSLDIAPQRASFARVGSHVKPTGNRIS